MTVTLESILWGYFSASRLIVLALESGGYQAAVEDDERRRFRVVDGDGKPLNFPSQSDLLRQFHGLTILDIYNEHYSHQEARSTPVIESPGKLLSA